MGQIFANFLSLYKPELQGFKVVDDDYREEGRPTSHIIPARFWCQTLHLTNSESNRNVITGLRGQKCQGGEKRPKSPYWKSFNTNVQSITAQIRL